MAYDDTLVVDHIKKTHDTQLLSEREKHLIDFAHDGMPQILCTPWLVWFLEHWSMKRSPAARTSYA